MQDFGINVGFSNAFGDNQDYDRIIAQTHWFLPPPIFKVRKGGRGGGAKTSGMPLIGGMGERVSVGVTVKCGRVSEQRVAEN